jgi:hypothetical protein
MEFAGKISPHLKNINHAKRVIKALPEIIGVEFIIILSHVVT